MRDVMFGVLGLSGGEVVLILIVLAILAMAAAGIAVVLYFIFRAPRKPDSAPPPIVPAEKTKA